MTAAHETGDLVDFDPSGDEVNSDLVLLDDGDVEVLAAEDGDDISENEMIPTDEGKKIRKRIKQLAEKIQDSYWELSELVARVHNERIFKQWGFKKFSDWVQTEFDVGRRKAYYFVQIQNYFRTQLKNELPEANYNAAVEVAKSIGWNKALVLATEQVLTKDNVEDVLIKAQDMSYDVLKNECKALKKNMSKEQQEESAENNTMKMVRKSYQFTTAQEVDLNRALERAKSSMREGAKDSSAMALICAEYVGMNPEGSLEEKLSNFERLLGVNLIACDQECSTILYGAETLKNLASEQ